MRSAPGEDERARTCPGSVLIAFSLLRGPPGWYEGRRFTRFPFIVFQRRPSLRHLLLSPCPDRRLCFCLWLSIFVYLCLREGAARYGSYRVGIVPLIWRGCLRFRADKALYPLIV